MASKKTPEINGGSMADISFLMLIFFLMVSTMDPETGLSRRLPPMPPENAQLEDLKVNRRNMLDVKINSRNGVMAGFESCQEHRRLWRISGLRRCDIPSERPPESL